jgi:hypothetical protein
MFGAAIVPMSLSRRSAYHHRRQQSSFQNRGQRRQMVEQSRDRLALASVSTNMNFFGNACYLCLRGQSTLGMRDLSEVAELPLVILAHGECTDQ